MKDQDRRSRPTFQFVWVHRKGAGVPLVHRHPSDDLLHPLVKPQLPEGVLLAGVLLCRVAGSLHIVDADRNAKGRIRFLPNGRVCSVIRLVRPIDHRVEGRVDLPALDDIERLLVDFVTDAVRICPGGRDKKVKRLGSGVSGSLRHDIVELPVWLGVELIKYYPGGIKTVLVCHICGEYLVGTVCRKVNKLLRRNLLTIYKLILFA